MGANQSRPCEATVNEKLMERLQALNMKDDRPMNEKDGFVVVGGEPGMFISLKKGARCSYTDVQSSQIYSWCKVPARCIRRVSVRVGEGAYGGPKGTTATTLLSTYALLLHYLHIIEPPRSRSPQLEPRQRRPLVAIGGHLRYSEVQHQDPL